MSEWLALTRVHRGSVTKLGSRFLYHERPVGDHLAQAVDLLIRTEHLALDPPDAIGAQEVRITHAGQVRYAELHSYGMRESHGPWTGRGTRVTGARWLEVQPLASVGVRGAPRAGETSGGCRRSVTRPLVLRGVCPAPEPYIPKYIYDPQRQIAVDFAGHPFRPSLAKEWTTVPGTHTDGDGGDNENWEWEEV